MTMVAISPVSSEEASNLYHAVSGDKQSQGRTPGEALDGLMELLPEESGTHVIVRNLRPGRFFTAAKRQRLADFMER